MEATLNREPRTLTPDAAATALETAAMLFMHDPDWITFYREVLGTDGIVRKLFPTPEQLDAFRQTPQYSELLLMLGRLRDKKDPDGVAAGGTSRTEPLRVITVRLPRTLHQSLLDDAAARRTSMNQLCITRLLGLVDKAAREEEPVLQE